MDERPPQSEERIEREVIVERTTSGGASNAPRRSPMWAWVVPLVIVALVLMWYVVTRGEPRSLFGYGPAELGEIAALALTLI